MIGVTDARTLPDYRMWVRFSDATDGEIDLKDFIASDVRPIVVALRDQAAFSALRVEMDTVGRMASISRRSSCRREPGPVLPRKRSRIPSAARRMVDARPEAAGEPMAKTSVTCDDWLCA